MGEQFEYVIGIGTNLGHKEENIQQALAFLDKDELKIVRYSTFYTTQPWGFESDNTFLNACALVQTGLEPIPLLEKLKQFEKKSGRLARQGQVYEDRLIDLDILACGNLVFNHVSLVIPHPHLHERTFALKPMNEICGHWVHPVLGKTVRELLDALPEK